MLRKVLYCFRRSDFSEVAWGRANNRAAHTQFFGNQPIRDRQGVSQISIEDYAMAMVDEVENPQHSQQ